MSKTVDFIFDFASPNAYLVHKIVPKLKRAPVRFLIISPVYWAVFSKRPAIKRQ